MSEDIDIIERLKKLLVWMPDRTTAGGGSGWGKNIISAAINEIEFLRSLVAEQTQEIADAGAVTRSESFEDIKRRVPNSETRIDRDLVSKFDWPDPGQVQHHMAKAEPQ